MNPTPAFHGRLAGAAGALLVTSPAALGQVSSNATGAPWLDGVTHPFDDGYQIGALLLVGAAGALIGGNSRWGLPVMFLSLLGFGLILGAQGATAPMLDTIVMTTGLALVLLIIGKVHLVFAVVTSILGAFALFHGVEDGFTLRPMNAGTEFLLGYFGATLALMVIGLLLGTWMHRHAAPAMDIAHRLNDRFHGLRHGF